MVMIGTSNEVSMRKSNQWINWNFMNFIWYSNINDKI